LGIVFQNEIANLLNPANGRMEIAPAENKRSGGFSRGFIGTQSVFYSGSYMGFYNDIRVITHEATHAVHRQLMTKAGVLPVYATGPNYFFESFAMFSEFLLSDYLIKTAPSAELKQFYLEKYFDGKGMALFTIAQDALLEQEIYDGVAFGNIRNEDDLTAANEKVNQLFSIWPTTVYPQQNLRWVTNSLFYEDPFYNINYVLGVVLALKYYEMYKADKAAFSKKYLTLLTNGFTDAPAPLLKKYFNINIDDPRLLKNAFGIIRSKVDELESLYKK
jgi:oligoendopeptidase F